MKKLIFFVLGITIFYNVSYPQSQWEVINNFGSGFNTEHITNVDIVNGNNIYFVSTRTDFQTLYRTTNKGVNWSTTLIATEPSQQVCVDFVNENTGIIAVGNKLYHTNDGGQNVTSITSSDITSSTKITKVKYRTGNQAYILSTREYNNGGTRYVRIQVGIVTNTTYTQWFYKDIETINGTVHMTDIDYSSTNSAIAAICGYFRASSISNPTSLCFYSTNAFGSATELQTLPSSRFDHLSFLPGSTDFRVFGNKGISYFWDISPTTGPTVLSSLGVDDLSKPQFGLSFVTGSTGYAAANDGKIYKTTNGGENWSQELTGLCTSFDPNLTYDLTFYNGIVMYGGCSRELLYRKLGTNVYTLFDGIARNGSMYIDGINYNTNSSNPVIFLRGGTSSLEAYPSLQNSSLNENAIFYKWSDNYMELESYTNFDNEGFTIQNHYKTKKYSNSGTAVNNSSQRRAVRDRFGRVNTVHESLGGIFFTKSTDNGSTFIKEEVVNDNPNSPGSYASDNNINSFLTEVQRLEFMQDPYQPELQSIEKTPLVCWERKNGTTININLATRRKKLITNPEYYWQTDADASFQLTGVTDQNFKVFPKVISCIRAIEPFTDPFPPNVVDTLYKHFYAVTYLKPDVSGSKLMVRCIDQGSNPSLVEEFEIVTGDVSEVSVEGVFSETIQPYSVDIYMTYKKDNKIYYRKENFQYSSIGMGGTIYRTPDSNPFEISSTDGLSGRWTPDISLRNGLPVVAYRGSKSVVRIIQWMDGGPGGPGEPLFDEMNIVRNPIYVRKQSSNGVWGSFDMIFNSSGPELQHSPDVEGSKDADAYVVGFSVGNPTAITKKFARVGNAPYYCNPPTFTGNDAMFVKGSYTGTLGSTSHPMIWTSKPENSLWKIDKQSFTISNALPTPDTYSNLAGIVGMDGIDYTFTLGPIFAASTVPALDPKDAPTLISGFLEFNENMVSEPFVMSDGDTLILGAAGSYTTDPITEFASTIRYDVNLVYKSNNNIHRVLFSDTVTIGDSLEPEFLRGYVIESIPNGSDSFYVQLVLNENDLNDGDYTLNGVYMGTEEDDNSNYKTAVFFDGELFQNNTAFIPKEYALSQNYPNPFNPSTTISYDLPKDGLVRMKVYDIAGREVLTLVNEVKTAGRYTASFNGSTLSSGVYFYRIEAGDFVQTKRMVLVK